MPFKKQFFDRNEIISKLLLKLLSKSSRWLFLLSFCSSLFKIKDKILLISVPCMTFYDGTKFQWLTVFLISSLIIWWRHGIQVLQSIFSITFCNDNCQEKGENKKHLDILRTKNSFWHEMIDIFHNFESTILLKIQKEI